MERLEQYKSMIVTNRCGGTVAELERRLLRRVSELRRSSPVEAQQSRSAPRMKPALEADGAAHGQPSHNVSVGDRCELQPDRSRYQNSLGRSQHPRDDQHDQEGKVAQVEKAVSVLDRICGSWRVVRCSSHGLAPVIREMILQPDGCFQYVFERRSEGKHARIQSGGWFIRVSFRCPSASR